MNIHCVDIFSILMLVVSLATAQHSWDDIFGFHRRVNYDIPTVIEVHHPRMVRIYDDGYRQSLRHLHLFEPFDPPQPVIPAPVVYLPRIHLAPEVYVDDLHPFVYNNRFYEPFAPPYLNRLHTTVSVSYKTRLVRVVDKDENEETVADSLTSDTNTVAQEVTTAANDPKATSKSTPKKDGNGGTTTSKPQSNDKKVTPKPSTKAETVTKPDAEQKPNDGKTTESTTNLETTKDKAVDGIQSEPVEMETKNEDKPEAASDATTSADNGNDGNAEPAPTENTDGSTDVPAE